MVADVRKALTEQHGTTFCKLEDADEWQKRAQGAWPQLYELVGGGKPWVDATVGYLKTGEMK